MKVGDYVELTMDFKSPPSKRYFVKVEKIGSFGIYGPYAWQENEKPNYEMSLKGSFGWGNIEESRIIPGPFRPNDGEIYEYVANDAENLQAAKFVYFDGALWRMRAPATLPVNPEWVPNLRKVWPK